MNNNWTINVIVTAQFLIKFLKTKITVITLANQKGHRESSKPIKARNNKLLQAADAKRGKTRSSECVTVGFDFTSDWMKKWREFFNQSCSVIDFWHSNENRCNSHSSNSLIVRHSTSRPNLSGSKNVAGCN